MTPHPLIEKIADLFLRADAAPARENMDAAHRARLRFEWATGQWVMLASKGDQFWGWMSWYRCTAEIFERLQREYLRAVMEAGEATTMLTEGPCVYVASAVIAPWAPRHAYRRLYELVAAANRDARIIGCHFTKRDGRRLWHERVFH